MSEYSSYNTYESEEEETSGWLLTSETSLDDDLSDELTLLNGDEDCDEDTSSFEALIQLSIRLKKEYNLREAAVQLERCDKIWDTIQLVKKMQLDCENETASTDEEGDGDEDDDEEEEEDEDDDEDDKDSKESSNSHLPEALNPSAPYIKYQPVQGNGNTALPNFYLSVKSQKMLFHCVACGRQFTERRSLRLHSVRDHGMVIPKRTRKTQQSTDSKTGTQDVNDNKIINNSGKDRENSKSRLSNTSNNSTDQKSHRKRERDKSAVKLEPKKEPEENPKRPEIRPKEFACRVCKSTYRYNRGVIKHMIKAHNMTLAEAGTPDKVEEFVAPVEPPKEAPKARDTKKVKSVTEESSDYAESSTSGGTMERLKKLSYFYTCKSCGSNLKRKRDIRSHLLQFHKIKIPKGEVSRRQPGQKVADYDFYTTTVVEFKRPRAARQPPKEKKVTRVYRQKDKNYRASRVIFDETQPPRETRRSRQMNDSPNPNPNTNPNRPPQRSCAKNTSYTDCTKEEEEVLRTEILFTNSSATVEDSGNASGSQTKRCFLCKRSPTDMEKHLQDYHKIKCLEKILPLTDKPEENENDEQIASGESLEPIEKPAKRRKIRRSPPKQEREKSEMKGEYIRILYNTMYRSVLRRRLFQCTICSYKFSNGQHIRRHLENNTKNGVICDHLAPIPKNYRHRKAQAEEEERKRQKSSESSSRSESRSTSEEEVTKKIKARKRGRNSGNVNEPRNKKRKIHEAKALVNPVSDSASDEPDPLLIVSEQDSVFDDKSANPRDTRDSSDRDSGIGISITIKKRNNSYEVVEKDSGDDEKFKEHSKNGGGNTNSSAESTSFSHTPVLFFNDDQEARRREVLNSLDSSVEQGIVVESVMTAADKIVDENTLEEVGDLGNYEEANVRLLETNEYPGDNTNANLNGIVPSLKIMCKTVLKTGDELTNQCAEKTISHQCPVCHRFYPTERDVTVHMIEHKISRDDFRPARVHAIPSSALIRYGRRPL